MPRKRSSKPRKPISEKTRTGDEKLRESIRHIDLKLFDRALQKAIRPTR